MSSLYNLTGDLLQIQSMLEEDVDAEVLRDTLEAVEGEYEIKLESYCKIIRNLEGDTEVIKSEEKRLSDKRKTLESNIEKLKRNIYESMKATGKEKVKGTLFTLNIQKNGGKIPVIQSDNVDTSNLPDDLVIITEKPDLNAIREKLEAGEFIEGFTLGERGESLRIK